MASVQRALAIEPRLADRLCDPRGDLPRSARYAAALSPTWTERDRLPGEDDHALRIYAIMLGQSLQFDEGLRRSGARRVSIRSTRCHSKSRPCCLLTRGNIRRRTRPSGNHWNSRLKECKPADPGECPAVSRRRRRGQRRICQARAGRLSPVARRIPALAARGR